MHTQLRRHTHANTHSHTQTRPPSRSAYAKVSLRGLSQLEFPGRHKPGHDGSATEPATSDSRRPSTESEGAQLLDRMCIASAFYRTRLLAEYIVI